MRTNLLTRLFQDSGNHQLRHELLTLVHNDQDTANRLVTHQKRRNPGKSEQWYLEKVIYDLRR